MRRPLTETRLLSATTKRSSRPKKLARWKKLPVNVNVNGSIGNPAGPIPAPGGRPPAAVAVEAAVVGVGAGGVVPVVPGVGDGVVGAEPAGTALSVSPWKSTPALEAAVEIW